MLGRRRSHQGDSSGAESSSNDGNSDSDTDGGSFIKQLNAEALKQLDASPQGHRRSPDSSDVQDDSFNASLNDSPAALRKPRSAPRSDHTDTTKTSARESRASRPVTEATTNAEGNALVRFVRRNSETNLPVYEGPEATADSWLISRYFYRFGYSMLYALVVFKVLFLSGELLAVLNTIASLAFLILLPYQAAFDQPVAFNFVYAIGYGLDVIVLIYRMHGVLHVWPLGRWLAELDVFFHARAH